MSSHAVACMSMLLVHSQATSSFVFLSMCTRLPVAVAAGTLYDPSTLPEEGLQQNLQMALYCSAECSAESMLRLCARTANTISRHKCTDASVVRSISLQAESTVVLSLNVAW